jgi:murein DD-endopeptidase MepM/ murein hydrolase activator NlpD
MPNTLTHRGRTHPAIDIGAEKGTPIVSPVSGKVVSVQTTGIGGNNVRIAGNDGNTYYFAHMRDAANVKQGQLISGGQHIGFVGNTGSASSTEPHLHFSVKRGNSYVNPVTMLEGASQGGGVFAMDSEVAIVPQGKGSMSQVINPWIESLSDTIAGGQRADPRELLSLEEPEEPPVEQAPSLGRRIGDALGIR